MHIKKYIKITIFTVGFLLINNQVFAQESNTCTVCSLPAQEFDMILNMTNELVNYIKTTGKEWDYIWDYINPNRYAWNKFTPPSNKKKLTNLVLKTESLITSTALILAPTKFWWIEDYIFWFSLMFKNKVFPRDYKKILDIEGRISDKIYELWLWWWYYSQINGTNINDIKNILKKYKEKWLLSSYYLSEDIRYKDIVNQANKIASSLKNFLATNNTKQFWWFNWNLTLNISPDKINSMKTAYECSNDCNETKKKLSDEIKAINDSTKWWITTAFKTIARSVKKFKEEIDWIKTKNMFQNTLKINWLTWINKDIKNIWESIKSDKKKLETTEVLKDLESDTEKQTTSNTDTKSILQNSILWTIANHKEDLAYAVATETKNTNYYFENLSKIINRNIETIKTFKKNLIESANLQCSK